MLANMNIRRLDWVEDLFIQPAYHRVLTELESHTGVPVVLNTSFNIHGEPIVCTPRDALSVLVRRGVDVLVIEGFVVRRNKA